MIALLLSFLATLVYADVYDIDLYKKPFPIFNGTQEISHGLWDPSPPQFEDLQLAYTRGEYRTYEEFTDYLLGKEPELRKQFVLIHHSESQQMSSKNNPRIILFKGATLYSLSDHPLQRFPKVEILSAQRNSKEIKLQEIVFKNNTVEFREKPKSCFLCHGSLASPLWGPYASWNLTTFGGTSKTVYTGNSALVERMKLITDRSKSRDQVWGFTSTVMNLFFRNWFLHNLNPIKLPYPQGLRVLHSVYCLSQNQDNHVVDTQYADDFLKEVQQTQDAYAKYLKALNLKYNGFDEIEPSLYYNNKQDLKMRMTLEWLGISSTSFTPSLVLNRYATSTAGDGRDAMMVNLKEVRPDLFEGIPWKPKLLAFTSSQYSVPDLDCKDIEGKINQSPIKVTRPSRMPFFREVSAELPVMTRCTQCHVTHLSDSSKAVPTIPFSNVVELAKILRDPNSRLKEKILKRVGSHGPDQMPPGQGLNSEEIEAMKEFLEDLE